MTTKLKLIRRERKAVDVALLDKIFHEALEDSLKEYEGVIRFKYTLHNVPQTGKGIYQMYQEAIWGNEFRVYTGSNDPSLLYFSADTNLLYRTLHDLDHAKAYAKGYGTTKVEDERYLNCLVAKRVYKYALRAGYRRADAIMAFFAVYHDNVGQVNFYAKHKDFCSNQRAHTADLMANCKGVQQLLIDDNNLYLAHLTMCDYMKSCGVPLAN